MESNLAAIITKFFKFSALKFPGSFRFFFAIITNIHLPKLIRCLVVDHTFLAKERQQLFRG